MPFHRSRTAATVLAASVAALATVLGLGAAPAQAADQQVPVPDGATTVVVSGQGYGHGHGMSQYGAKEAAEQGRTYRQILAFYYPGTRWGTSGGNVSVLITADTSNDVVVGARSGLTVRSLGSGRTWRLDKARPRAVRWRITPASATRSTISWRARTGRWQVLRTVAGDAQFAASGRPIRLFTPSGAVDYRGTLRSATAVRGRTARDTVNIVSLEAYVKGVVPHEMPALWHYQAVRAQAVAARTYAAFERAEPRARHYQICDTTSCQVYGGYTAEHAASNRAIDATRHQVLTYGGKPAFTQFSSSNGGWMLAGSQPYLVSGRDTWDPASRWEKSIPLSRFADRWPSAGKIQGLTVRTYPKAGGWVETVTIDGAKRDYEISGSDFRSWAGLRAANFTLAVR